MAILIFLIILVSYTAFIDYLKFLDQIFCGVMKETNELELKATLKLCLMFKQDLIL